MNKKVRNRAGESAPYYSFGHVMATSRNPFSYSRQCELGAGNPEIEKMDGIVTILQLASYMEMGSSRKRCLNPKSASCFISSSISVSISLPARNATLSGEKGDKPAAIMSALMKFRQSAYFGRNSRANVVFPAPFGPAIM